MNKYGLSLGSGKPTEHPLSRSRLEWVLWDVLERQTRAEYLHGQWDVLLIALSGWASEVIDLSS
jgi:hypothetical protein